MVKILLMVESQIGELISSAMKRYWIACRSSMVKKKNTPDAKDVLLVFE